MFGAAGAVACDDWQPELGYAAVRGLIEQGAKLEALICFNDRLALGAYNALADAGLAVPSDVSVVSFDDDPIASWVRPQLTTIAIPHYELGRQVDRAAARRPDGSHDEQPNGVPDTDAASISRVGSQANARPGSASTSETRRLTGNLIPLILPASSRGEVDVKASRYLVRVAVRCSLVRARGGGGDRVACGRGEHALQRHARRRRDAGSPTFRATGTACCSCTATASGR